MQAPLPTSMQPCGPTRGLSPEPSGALRVALFSGNYNYVRDGANQALNLLVGDLLSWGVKVRVYSPVTKRPAFAPTGDLVPVASLPLPAGRDEYRLACGLPRRIRRDLEAFAPDIVHVSAPDILGHRALSWARTHGIATVASLHTRFETYPRYYRLGLLEGPLEWMLRRFYDRSDTVLVPAPGMAALIRGWGVRTPVAIWSRGVDHARFSPGCRDLQWRRDLGIGDDDLAIGFLGRLVKEKGLDVFADVARALVAGDVRHKLLVIGDGPARDWFAQQVPGAVFAGFQRGEALGRAVASMDVFFNPSVTETFGNVTLEAMAAGVPVVGARATGTSDLIDDGVTGFLVPPRDAGAYADAIGRIAADPALRRALGAAGHAKAAGYQWKAINAEVLGVYRDLVARRAASARV